MNWILADLLMFVCSIGLYLAVRKAALDKLPAQFNNLAMYAIPTLVFVSIAVITRQNLAVSLSQALWLLLAGTILSYLGNYLSLVSISLAPNAGYSLIITKSYVVLTSVLAVILFGAPLTLPSVIAIALIVASSALIMINPKAAHHAKSTSWVPLAIGSFFCFGFLSLLAKHLISGGMPTIVFLGYLFSVTMICIVVELAYKRVRFQVVSRHIRPFLLIGIVNVGFQFFNFYAVSLAPNVGFVNATNTASIGAVTVLSVILFKDELTKQKLIGISGAILGLLLLFTWK